jgi:adenylate kinase
MTRIILISENTYKIAEYRRQFRQYGVEIETLPWNEDETSLDKSITDWLKAAEGDKPAYALNEWSDIYNAETHEVSAKNTDMEPVYNKGKLIVYWLDDAGKLVKSLRQHRVYGYIDLSRRREAGFDWDGLFVNAITGKSYSESMQLWGKCTPRQLLISDFIQQYLFYKKRKVLKFGDYAAEETVEFSPVSAELEKNKLLHTVRDKPLGNFVRHAINDGIHLRFAKNRRENNYWMPGLNGGLPSVAKPDPVHETTYRFHDLTHYGLAPVCDLIPGDDFGGAAHRVYHAARMMSEALSLVMADMLFVDGLKKSGVDYDYAKRNVHPLFEQIADQGNLKAICQASVKYALLGDDSYFRGILKPGAEPDKALANFQEWYSRFFSADHGWTNANFVNMSKQGSLYKDWIEAVGRFVFARSHLSLLDDVTRRIVSKGAKAYPDVVDALFEDVFDNHLRPRLEKPAPKLSEGEEISNAFRRYLIGQSLFYIRYAALPGMAARAERMFARLETTDYFGPREIAETRREYEKDVMFAQAAQVITHDDRRIFTQIFPVFPPVYLEGYEKQGQDLTGVIGVIFEEQAWANASATSAE